MAIDRTNYNALVDDNGTGTTGSVISKATIKDVLLDPIDAAIVAPTGLFTLPTGQIKFPATQNPSSDPNTLDDYEEGTWTPTLAFGGASVGMTFGSRQGRYVKVGRLVFVCGAFALTNKGSSVGNASIEGLPFASAPAGAPSCMFFNRTGSLVTITAITGSIPPNASSVNLGDYVGNVANNGHFTNTTFTDGMLGVYEAAA